MRCLMDRVFAHYGREAVIRTGEVEKRVKVFFHSVNSRSWQNMEQVFFPLGEVPRGQYICILPAATAAVGDTLMVGGKTYQLCRVEDMTVREKAVYQWGLCKEKGRGDTWGSAE